MSRAVTAPATEDDLDESVLADLRRCLGSDADDLIPELIGVYLKEARVNLDEMAAGLSVGDADRVARAAHRLRGSSGYVGARNVAATSAEIEGKAEQDGIADLDGRIGELRARLDALDRRLLG